MEKQKIKNHFEKEDRDLIVAGIAAAVIIVGTIVMYFITD